MHLFRFHSSASQRSGRQPAGNGHCLWNIIMARVKEQGLSNEVDNLFTTSFIQVVCPHCGFNMTPYSEMYNAVIVFPDSTY